MNSEEKGLTEEGLEGLIRAAREHVAEPVSRLDTRAFLLSQAVVTLADRLSAAEERGKKAGLEMVAKWADERPTFRCEDCGHEGRVIRSSACCGDECPKCGGVPVRIVVDGAAIRSLALTPTAQEKEK